MLKRILIIYVVLLVVSAWPVKATSVALSWLARTSSRVLRTVSVLSGQALFYRPYPEVNKVRGGCFEVKGFAADGLVVPISATNGLCWSPPAYGDIKEIMLFRLVEDAAVERLLLRANKMDRISLKEKAIFEVIGDFFCHSSLVDRMGRDFERIEFGFTRRHIHYQSGKHSTKLAMLVKWNCANHQIEFAEWLSKIPPQTAQAFYDNKPW